MIILIGYLFIALGIVLSILFCKSPKSMNLFTIIHPTLSFGFTVYIAITEQLPATYLNSGYFLVDYLSIYEVFIAAFIFLVASIYAWGDINSLLDAKEMPKTNVKLFYLAFNALLLMIVFALWSNNLALFWIFLELTTLLSAVLIVTLNTKENIVAALEYVFIVSTAMIFTFIGLILVFSLSQQYFGVGTLNWTELLQQVSVLSPTLLTMAFVFIFVGFAAKSGIVPFHTWLPYTYSKAPSAVSVLLSASVSNLGMYGIIRITALMLHTTRASFYSWMLIIFGIMSVGIATFSLLQRTNIKKVIAISSIEQNGLMLIGIGIGTPLAFVWVLFHILAHALTKALLFFSAGIIHRQYGMLNANKIKNVFFLQPLASVGLILGLFAVIGMPPFALFVSKLFILVEIGAFSKWLLVITLLFLLIIIGALSLFFGKMFSQYDPNYDPKKFQAPWTMSLPIIILLVLIVALFVVGLFTLNSTSSFLYNFLIATVHTLIGGIA